MRQWKLIYSKEEIKFQRKDLEKKLRLSFIYEAKPEVENNTEGNEKTMELTEKDQYLHNKKTGTKNHPAREKNEVAVSARSQKNISHPPPSFRSYWKMNFVKMRE